jgi:hypothetical protein
MDPTELVALHLRIDTSINTILQDGKLDKHDIPQLVFLLSEFMLRPSATLANNKLTPEMLTNRMNEMYTYVMTHYNLYPADDSDKAAYKQLFDISVKLLVYNPKLMKEAKSCLPCFF